MKYVGFDAVAFLEGVIGLNGDERGFYITVIALLYARAPRVDVTDELVCKAMACNPRSWRAVKKRLVEKGKIWTTPDGYLMAKRVEWCVNEARMHSERQSNRARMRWQKDADDNENNGLLMPLPAMQPRNASSNQKKDKLTFFLTAAREDGPNEPARSLASALPSGALACEPDSTPAEGKQVADKKPEELTLAEINEAWRGNGSSGFRRP